MAKIEIYTSPFCGFCHRAKQLLNKKGAPFVEIDVFATPGARDEMMGRSEGRHTVPQIFIDGKGIGGCDDLYDLERHGKLDGLLKA